MKLREKIEAQKFRRRGYSLKEISSKLDISKSTASIWVRGISLSNTALKRLQKHVTKGQLVAAESKKKKTQKLLESYYKNAKVVVSNVSLDNTTIKIICAMLYWCEGGKYDNTKIQFVNSDPDLIATFLNFFRRSYDLDEKKFSLCIHLHSYHSEVVQKNFWAEVTKVPKNQFMKSYIKPNGGRRIKKDYPGCLAINYYDANVARDLVSTGRAFINKYRSVR